MRSFVKGLFSPKKPLRPVGSAALDSGSRNGKVRERMGSPVSFKALPNISKQDIAPGNDNQEKAVPVPKEDKLILKQCPRGRKTPCIAPFLLKLETFLRVHGIKYELDFNGHEPKLYGSPWIRFNNEDITDSLNVIQFLINTYDIQTEKNLTSSQHAKPLRQRGIALWRWVYDGARSLKEIQLLPKKIQELIPDVCKTVKQAAWCHGIGKMTPGEVKNAVLKDLGSLSEFLGDKKFFLDTDVPTQFDCGAFGMLAQFLWNMTGPFHDAILNSHENLINFCWRMRITYWPDWEDCLNNKDFYSAEPYPSVESSPSYTL